MKQYKLGYVAGLLWILSAQCVVVQFVVQSFWMTPFSLDFNTISDLGATQCQDARSGPNPFVCSPLHAVMNASFFVFGLMWIIGAMLLKHGNRLPFDSKAISVPLTAAGIGAVLVGLFPEDGIGILHSTGATMEMVGAMIGFVAAGLRLLKQGSQAIGTVSIAIGTLSIVAFVLFLVTYLYHSSILGLRLGGWERIAYWSENVWLVGAGIWVIRATQNEPNRCPVR